jgi:hypothetical protein
MDQKNAINNDLLIFRNYNEFSADNLVELPVDYIATIMNPDKNIVNYYITEKKKQDLPGPSTLKEIFEDVDNLEFDGPFDLPTEIIDQMMNGIQENLHSIEGLQPPKKKKKSKKAPPSSSKNKVDPTWGNKYTDWPIDPNDYL